MKSMGFQKRLLATYSLLIILLVLILAILFYQYSTGLFERSSQETTRLLAFKLSDQLDNVLKPMDFISTNLISDASFKSAVSVLDTLDRTNPDNARFISEAEQTIRKQLYTYSIIENFHAVTVFNRKDDFFTSNFLEHSKVNSAGGNFNTLTWMPQAELAAGRLITVPIAEDPFQNNKNLPVFGRARVVPGLEGELGCIAVFHTEDVLESVFTASEPDHLLMLAYLPSGQLFYQSSGIEPEVEQYYSDLVIAGGRPFPADFSKNPITGDIEYAATSVSTYTGITVVLVLDRKALLAPLAFSRNLTIGIGFLIILFSLVYNFISSKLLTKPLRLIKTKIEDTELSNLAGGELIEHENDEIAALDRAFMHLKQRLLESIEREVDSRALWLKARLDSLQSQVDPHFINNILTVIASRGLEVGDDEICGICDGVASMLRYSTSTTKAWATMEEELGHLKTYLYLIKQRLEDRFNFEIDIDERIHTAELPKIIFQQIAENSISHGYRKRGGPIHLSVKGRYLANRWQVELADDGDGIDSERMLLLQEQIESISKDPDRSVLKQGLKLGGMGLISTYARLYLFFQGDVDWKIENLQPHGVRVVLGGPIIRHNREEGHA